MTQSEYAWRLGIHRSQVCRLFRDSVIPMDKNRQINPQGF